MQRKKSTVRVKDQANDQARRPHSKCGTAKINKMKANQMTVQVANTVKMKKHKIITMMGAAKETRSRGTTLQGD